MGSSKRRMNCIAVSMRTGGTNYMCIESITSRPSFEGVNDLRGMKRLARNDFAETLHGISETSEACMIREHGI